MKPGTLPFFLLVLLIMTMSTVACSDGVQKFNLSGEDNGSALDVEAGALIVIKLDGNPSTGFTWEAQNLDTSLFEQVGESEFTSSSPGILGAGGTQVMTFKVLKTGSGTLTLVYRRPWEENVEPLESYSVDVTIK